MKTLKLMVMMGIGALVSACDTTDTVPRDTALGPQSVQAQQDVQGASIRVDQINVLVPLSLKVSERNSYYPGGDIVWREDPIGNRHAQVKAIFEAGLRQGTQDMQGETGLRLDVKVMRFHALTEKARYTTGGVHAIIFALLVRDAKTGVALGEPRIIEADLAAFGGQQAINAEARGHTQKVRITNHLAEVIRRELTDPKGYENPRLGFFQRLNRI